MSEFGVRNDQFAESTQDCLDDWARQMQLVMNQPSANWSGVILNLCKAVESELAARLGRIEGLNVMESQEALGVKARMLGSLGADPSLKRRLAIHGLKPGFVLQTLPSMLKVLARLRGDSAHGGINVKPATTEKAQEVRRLVGQILKQLASKQEMA